MEKAIAVLGTFDSKGSELTYISNSIIQKGFRTICINVGTKENINIPVDYDFFKEIPKEIDSRDQRIEFVIDRAKELILKLELNKTISGIISVGGGSGTYISTEVFKVLPFGFPKIMISTVASRDMSKTVGTKDITMIHSVFDMLGVTSLSKIILEEAANAVCSMAQVYENSDLKKTIPRIALTLFGFITEAAVNVKKELEAKGYEVIPFHANGTGGMAMEELARKGYFDAVVDLATHELADQLLGGYCGGIGPDRLEAMGQSIPPRIVVPGGLDCAVLIFDRNSVPERFRDRQIFFYDFRSAIRLNQEETTILAKSLAKKLNGFGKKAKVLIPMEGWSEADRKGGPLYNTNMRDLFIEVLKNHVVETEIVQIDLHINDPKFSKMVVMHLDELLKNGKG